MKLVTLTIAALFSALALANGPAPKDVYDETVELCKEWAVDDGIPADEVQAYVNKCVKDDLENMGYTNEKPTEQSISKEQEDT